MNVHKPLLQDYWVYLVWCSITGCRWRPTYSGSTRVSENLFKAIQIVCLYSCMGGTSRTFFVSLMLLFRAEVEAYKALDPGVRVVILKALCDIRVEVKMIKHILLNFLLA